MFTWICPKCGGEVPPSLNECPRCTQQQTAAPPSSTVSAPVATATLPAAAPSPPPSAIPPAPASSKVPPAAIAIGATLGIVALLAVLYLWVLPRRSAATAPSPAPVENAGAPSAHPLAKHLEISGLRVQAITDGNANIQFLVVNHSGADLPDMQMDVTISAAGKEVFTFPVALPSIGPYESKELSAKVKTELKPYELPDWQVLRTSFRLRN